MNASLYILLNKLKCSIFYLPQTIVILFFLPVVPIIPSAPIADEEDVSSKVVEGEDGEEEQEIQLEPTQEEMEKERLQSRAEQV